MRRTLRVVGALAGAGLATVGVVCMVVSSLVVERSDGFSIELGSHRFRMPESGMLGDANTYIAGWGFLGLFCIGAAILATVLPRVESWAVRGPVPALLALALVMVFLFARSVLGL